MLSRKTRRNSFYGTARRRGPGLIPFPQEAQRPGQCSVATIAVASQVNCSVKVSPVNPVWGIPSTVRRRVASQRDAYRGHLNMPPSTTAMRYSSRVRRTPTYRWSAMWHSRRSLFETGDQNRAAVLFGIGETFRRGGMSGDEIGAERAEWTRRATRAAIGEAAFAAQGQLGLTLSNDEAIRYVNELVDELTTQRIDASVVRVQSANSASRDLRFSTSFAEGRLAARLSCGDAGDRDCQPGGDGGRGRRGLL